MSATPPNLIYLDLIDVLNTGLVAVCFSDGDIRLVFYLLPDCGREDPLHGFRERDPAQAEVGEVHSRRVVDPPHHEEVGLQNA